MHEANTCETTNRPGIDDNVLHLETQLVNSILHHDIHRIGFILREWHSLQTDRENLDCCFCLDHSLPRLFQPSECFSRLTVGKQGGPAYQCCAGFREQCLIYGRGVNLSSWRAAASTDFRSTRALHYLIGLII